MDPIESRTFDEIKVGDSASLQRTLTPEDLSLFDGMWGGAPISTLLGTQLPGPGTTYLGEAQSAGIVPGARVPIVLTSRADSPLTRMASCAVALLWARRGPRL